MIRQAAQPVTRTFGAVTIGQAPRPDVTGEMLRVLGAGYRVVEAGALDGMSPGEIAALAPHPGDDVLVTRLTDGGVVHIAARHAVPLVRQRVNELIGKGLGLVVLLCTGAFPAFDTPALLLRPQDLLYQAAAALGAGLRLGVLTPTPDHIPQVRRQWAAVTGATPVVVAASPYQPAAALDPTLQELKAAGVNLVALDCIAYTLEMQARARAMIGVPTLLPRSLAARMVQELLG